MMGTAIGILTRDAKPLQLPHSGIELQVQIEKDLEKGNDIDTLVEKYSKHADKTISLIESLRLMIDEVVSDAESAGQFDSSAMDITDPSSQNASILAESGERTVELLHLMNDAEDLNKKLKFALESIGSDFGNVEIGR